MTAGPTRVLLIEDNHGDAVLIREMLAEARESYELEWCERLDSGLELLVEGEVDLLLLDLSLPDSHGVTTFETAHERVPGVPVIVLTGNTDSDVALAAVSQGAEDYLVKGEIGSQALSRAIHHAIERHRMREELRLLALRDDLTGLHNRRAFFTLAEHQLETARRERQPFAVLYMDLDAFKEINDTLGHRVGDQALEDTARIVQDTFRDCDIVARMGGDEFCVLLSAAQPTDVGPIISRLRSAATRHNTQADRPYRLELSIGAAMFDPADPISLDELVEEADRQMYENKDARRLQTPPSPLVLSRDNRRVADQGSRVHHPPTTANGTVTSDANVR